MNNKDNRDNCRFEFNYALTHKGDTNMLPVVTEESVKKKLPWKGLLGGALGGALFSDLSMPDFDKDPLEFQTKCDELYALIMKRITTTREQDEIAASAGATTTTSVAVVAAVNAPSVNGTSSNNSSISSIASGGGASGGGGSSNNISISNNSSSSSSTPTTPISTTSTATSTAAPASISSPPAGSTRDFERIYAFIMDPANASPDNHSLILSFLSDQGISTFDDLELLDEPAGFDHILNLLKPIPKKKLAKMLGRPFP